MRRATIVLVASLALIAAGATRAGAFVPGPTPTHDQFIAQLDSVCQPFVGQVNGAFGTYSSASSQLNRSAKRVNRAHKHGNRKALKKSIRAFVRATKLTGESLSALAQIQASLLDQINTLTPPPEGWFFSWYQHLKDEQSAEGSAAAAILQLRIAQFFTALDQADAAQQAAHRDISGIGLQVCSEMVIT
jgi:hypothetical protein